MRFVNVPMADLRGFILIQAAMDQQRNFFQNAVAPVLPMMVRIIGVLEIQIIGRGVAGIGSHHHQRLHFAGFNIARQLFQRFQIAAESRRRHRHRLAIDHRLAGVAQRLIHGVRQRVHHRRLRLARQHEAAPAMRLQIFRHAADKFCVARFAASARADAHRRGHRARQSFDRRSLQRHAMVRLAAGGGEHALRHIQPAHRALGDFASLGKRTRIAQKTRIAAAAQKIRVQREDHIRIFELVLRLQDFAKGHLRA